jgi:hypothetical protein
MWIVASTMAGLEFSMRDRLASLKPPVNVYFPLYRKKIIEPRPLFARYLFIETAMSPARGCSFTAAPLAYGCCAEAMAIP